MHHNSPYIWDQRSTGEYVDAGTQSLTNGEHGIVTYDNKIWGEIAPNQWFTNDDIYQTGAGDSEILSDASDDLVKIPILAYHDFTYETNEEDRYRMLFSDFENQISWLTDDLGYDIISLSDAYNYLKTNTYPGRKVAVLTFDDGYNSWSDILNYLQSKNLKATFFITENQFSTQSELTNIIETINNNDLFSIGNHTFSHINMSESPYWNQYFARSKNQDQLNQNNVQSVNFCAYPYGRYNYLSPMAVKNNGYLACFSYNDSLAYAFSSDFERYTIGRLEMESGDNINGDNTIDGFQNHIENGHVNNDFD